jgi:hypothetical protein
MIVIIEIEMLKRSPIRIDSTNQIIQGSRGIEISRSSTQQIVVTIMKTIKMKEGNRGMKDHKVRHGITIIEKSIIIVRIEGNTEERAIKGEIMMSINQGRNMVTGQRAIIDKIMIEEGIISPGNNTEIEQIPTVVTLTREVISRRNMIKERRLRVVEVIKNHLTTFNRSR